MTKITSFFSILVSLILMSVALTACDFGKNDDVWVVGTSADNPPYEYMENGELVGLDIDFITEIANYLGKKIEFKNMEFHSLLAALSTNNVDLVVAGMSITDERLNKVDFSIPYTSAKAAILYRSDDQLSQLSDFSKKIIAGQLGSIFNIIAQQIASDHNSEVNSLSNNLMLVEELKNERVDGIVLEISQAMKFAEQHQNLAYFVVTEYESSFAIAMPKDSKFKEEINSAIEALRENGTLNELEQKWGISSESE